MLFLFVSGLKVFEGSNFYGISHMPVLSRYDDQTDALRPPTSSEWRYDETSEDDGASSSDETLG